MIKTGFFIMIFTCISFCGGSGGKDAGQDSLQDTEADTTADILQDEQSDAQDTSIDTKSEYVDMVEDFKDTGIEEESVQDISPDMAGETTETYSEIEEPGQELEEIFSEEIEDEQENPETEPVCIEDEVGVFLWNDADIYTIKAGETLSGLMLCADKSEDWFRFVSENEQKTIWNFKLSLTGVSDVDFYLYKDGFASEWDYLYYSILGDPVTAELEKGTYYLRVVQYSGYGSYELSVQMGCSWDSDCVSPLVCDLTLSECVSVPSKVCGDGDDLFEDNNASSQAKEFPEPDKKAEGKICTDDLDWFKFNITEDGTTLNAVLDWTDTSDLDLYLFDESGNSIDIGYFEKPEKLSGVMLGKGTYYLLVSMFSEGEEMFSSYSLSVEAASEKCTSDLDCSKTKILRAKCLTETGVCVELESETPLENGSICDSGEDCASNVCANLGPFTDHSGGKNICSNNCSKNEECASLGEDFFCFSMVENGICWKICEKDDDCPVVKGYFDYIFTKCNLMETSPSKGSCMEIECTDNQACAENEISIVCDMETLSCVECMTDEDCKLNDSSYGLLCDKDKKWCYCKETTDCQEGQACDKYSEMCFEKECDIDADCPDPENQFCGNGFCYTKECENNDNCKDNPFEILCKNDTFECVECMTSQDCQNNPDALGLKCDKTIASKPYCVCYEDGDCIDNKNGKICDFALKYCGCDTIADCPDGSQKCDYHPDYSGVKICLY
jgi:hypothetical protein